MQKTPFAITLSSALIKALAAAIAIVALLLFSRTVMTVLLLFVLAIVFAMIINAPVSWLEKKKIKRGWARS
jgi:predicted PurR-regulated permease PerM